MRYAKRKERADDPVNEIGGIIVQDPQRGDLRPETNRRPDIYRAETFRTGHLLGMQDLEDRLVDLVEVRCLFLSSFMTVVGLTCNTRAVSRMPLAFIATSTICCLTAGDCPA
jgi:hypothetical protein